jgi:hypothetical protein
MKVMGEDIVGFFCLFKCLDGSQVGRSKPQNVYSLGYAMMFGWPVQKHRAAGLSCYERKR